MYTLHTPGPWSAFYKRKYDEWHVSVPLPGTKMTYGIFPNGVPAVNGTAEANAKLIAASPELLECLILAVRSEERNRKVMIDANAEMGFDEPKKLEWVEIAEAIIKKATGL
ncbi:hypothetical protein [Spirosoma sp.]|uniref:hypothetical protein n=1 Tax=Spirosoma sp. TaxID=1899569 RepID=UPI00261A56AF|nr:hypothetical protein [Spirosoma sp.]MCX6217579.1 hypothetical protein [Spirosoma sp.]